MTKEPQSLLALPSPVPKVKPDEIDRLLAVLDGTAAWMTAKELATVYDGLNERRVRAIAAAAGHRILSYPGSPGYRAFRHATIEEIDHAIEATEHQAHEMMKRSIGWRRAYHQRRTAA